MMKLFKVTTIVPEFHGHRNVCLKWLVDRRAVPENQPYSELIKNYADPIIRAGMTFQQERAYPEGAIDELFSHAEAETFVAWLKEYRNETDQTTKITEAALPIPFNRMGLRAMPVGGAIDHLILRELEGPTSPLGYSAYGYFDLRSHEPIDTTRPARWQFPSIVVSNGEIITDYEKLVALWEAGKLGAQDWGMRHEVSYDRRQ